jgi:tetratricopeptide (TPR) repeat protein
METTSKACLLLPASGAELAAAVDLGRKSPRLGSSHPFVPYFELAAGLAEYRQGQYAAAEQWTRKSLSHRWSNANLNAPNHLVLAMTLQRLGNANEARLQFSQGAALVRGVWPESRPGDLGGDWFDWLIARALLRDAENTVEGVR